MDGVHILDWYGAIVGTISLIIGTWDIIIDHADYKQDNPKKEMSPMRPKILLLDEPCFKAREIMEGIAECNTAWHGYSDVRGYDYIYTQFTPIEINVPVFCPCTSVEHIKAPKVVYLDDKWKETKGKSIIFLLFI